jgi:hypothetical protein
VMASLTKPAAVMNTPPAIEGSLEMV